VPAKGGLDQICKMGIANHQDQTALTQSLKGLCTNLLSCGCWCWLQAGLENRAGEGGKGSLSRRERVQASLHGWQVLKSDFKGKNNI